MKRSGRMTRKKGGMLRHLLNMKRTGSQSGVSANPSQSGVSRKLKDDIKYATVVNPIEVVEAQPVVDAKVVRVVPQGSAKSTANTTFAELQGFPTSSEIATQAKEATQAQAKVATQVKQATQDTSSKSKAVPIQEDKTSSLVKLANKFVPKPPSSNHPKTHNITRKIKASAAPLPKGPIPAEMMTAVKDLKEKILPPNPPKKPLPTPKSVTFVSVIKAILEDNIKIMTEAEPDPNKTPEIDETMIKQFYMTRIFQSEMADPSISAQVSGIDMIIPWSALDECTPILVAAKFGLVSPCKQIMESVDEAKQIEMLKDYDADGNTPLSLCAKYGYQTLCEYFIGKHQSLGVHLEGHEWDKSPNIPQKAEINALLGETIDLESSYSVFLAKFRDVVDKDRIPKYNVHLKRFESMSLIGNCEQNTPLMIASQNGHLGIVEMLLCGGSVKSVAKGNKTRFKKEIRRLCANPIATNSVRKTSLHLCAKYCCPTQASYNTIMGDVVASDPFRRQYNIVHDDKYRTEQNVWRFNRIIHFLLRFMIYEHGIIGGEKRPNGLKIALQNALYPDSKYDDGLGIDHWDTNLNQFTTFFFEQKINFISMFQGKYGLQSVESAIQHADDNIRTSRYITPFIDSNNNINDVVFNSNEEKCAFIKGDKNMFIELESGFSPDVFHKGIIKYVDGKGNTKEIDNDIVSFAEYFRRSVLYKKMYRTEKNTDNDRYIDAAKRGRNNYIRKIDTMERAYDLRKVLPIRIK